MSARAAPARAFINASHQNPALLTMSLTCIDRVPNHTPAMIHVFMQACTPESASGDLSQFLEYPTACASCADRYILHRDASACAGARLRAVGRIAQHPAAGLAQ